MGPTIDKVYDEAYQPYADEPHRASTRRCKRGEAPMREFMLKQTRQADVMLFARLAKLDAAVKAADVPFKVLVPAFVTSELKSAFQIGFLIFIPFLVIDMIVASVLMSLGMMMLSPVLVALPFKLMLFVLADGWNLLLGSLAASFCCSADPDYRSHAMDAQQVFTSASRACYLLLMVSAPVLLTVLGVGLRRQHLPGGHADPRGDAVVRAEARRRGRGARRRRAVDADHAGRVPAAHAAGDSRASSAERRPARRC